MNIGFDAKRLFSNTTGLGNYSRTIVKNLAQLYTAHQYHLYAPEVVINKETVFFTTQQNIQLHTPESQNFKSFWRTYKLASILENQKIDLYHGLSHELPVGIKSKNIKSVVTIHDLIFKIFPNTYPALDRLIYDRKFRYSCKVADHIIAISECSKNDIVKFYNIDPQKISVVYQSCNPLFFNKNTTTEGNSILSKYLIPSEYMLYVGAVTERKNIATLIKAYALLPKSVRIPLVLVGNGKKYMDYCKKLASNLKVEQDLYWITNLYDNSDLQTVYHHAQCFIYPSLYEGFGIPIIEALLSKTPVIASDASCLPEAGGANSLYFNPNDSKDLSEKIKEALTNQALRDDMIQKGYDFAISQFNAAKTTQNTFSVYQKLMS